MLVRNFLSMLGCSIWGSQLQHALCVCVHQVFVADVKNETRNVLFQSSKHPKITLLFLALFGFHPVIWHPVIYVSARSTLLATFFVLLTLYYYSSEQKRWLSLPCFLLAIMTKEIGLLAFLLTPLLYPDRVRRDLSFILNDPRRKQMTIAITLTLLFMVAWWKKRMFQMLFIGIMGETNNPHAYLHYVVTEFDIVVGYLVRYIYSYQWEFIYDGGLRDPSNPMSYFPLFVLMALFSYLNWLRQNRPRAAKMFFIGALTFLPEMLYPRGVLGQDQRCYIGYIFFTLGFYYLVIAMEKQKSRRIVIGGFLAFLFINSGVLLARTNIYKNK